MENIVVQAICIIIIITKWKILIKCIENNRKDTLCIHLKYQENQSKNRSFLKEVKVESYKLTKIRIFFLLSNLQKSIKPSYFV